MTPPKPTVEVEHPSESRSSRLLDLCRMFLKLGTIGFGGPQAHIALINDEAVVRRGWLTQEQFTEGLAICEMLPGPASTQMGIYTGYVRAGQWGALVAGLSFIAPAFLIVLALSWGYFKFQGLPQVNALFLGVSPVVSAIILAFCWKLGQKTIQTWASGAIAFSVFFLSVYFNVNVLLQFIIAGLIGIGLYRPPSPPYPPDTPSVKGWLLPPLPLLLANVPADSLTLSSVWGWERIQTFGLPLGLFFLKVGSFIFGGGLVIIPLLESEVVETFQWLTREEFINGVAIGQLSPGPVVLTAAFVGYKVAGVLGALVSAIAIFTPSFLFIMLASPILLRLRQNLWIKAFLKGVMPAVLGAIAAAAIPLAQSAFVHDQLTVTLGTIAIGIVALVALLRYKIPTWQLVPAGAGLGLLLGSLL